MFGITWHETTGNCLLFVYWQRIPVFGSKRFYIVFSVICDTRIVLNVGCRNSAGDNDRFNIEHQPRVHCLFQHYHSAM